MVRSTDRPTMTIAVDLGCKATKQTNTQAILLNAYFYICMITGKLVINPVVVLSKEKLRN